MQKIIFLLIITFLFISCSEVSHKEPLIFKPDNLYPKWLKTENYRTDQTSGITFIKTDEHGNKFFLLADDIGKIHRLKISAKQEFDFVPVHFSKKVKDYFSGFPKLDFEEIVYDKFSNKVFLSVEGNGENYLEYFGIFQLFFKDDNPLQDSIIDVKKNNITPYETYTKHITANTGFEGMAVDENYIYLGLENLKNNDDFTDSTLIYVVDKNTLTIQKEISTASFSIATICALCCVENGKILGVDRNSRNYFVIRFDENLEAKYHQLEKYKTVIPGYKNYEYIGSVEAITLDDEKNIFAVDDPWHKMFLPPPQTLKKLDENTIENFKTFVPIIFKYITY